MNYLITPPADPKIRVSLLLPASKSISNRILILNALSAAPHQTIHNLSDSDDTQRLYQALTEAPPDSPDRHIHIGAAGTAMRFLTAYFAQTPGDWTLTGTERMKNRPIRHLVDALNALGARIEYLEKEGYPPLHISGNKLQGGEVQLSGEVSSQYISALLMIAPLMKNGLSLHLQGNLISAPYIRLTIQLMRQFGAAVGWARQTLRIRPGKYKSIPFTVEADWSAASYWYAIAALSGQADIHLDGLFENSLQGDAAVAGLFARLGVETTFTGDGVRLRTTAERCKQLTYDFINEPDLAQTFVAVCLGLEIPFHFSGLQSLRIKETDRIEALKAESLKLGYPLSCTQDNTLEWNGERCDPEPHPVIRTYDDHRMAMAFAPLSLIREQGLAIAHPEVVSKSYPAFWDDLQRAGFKRTVTPVSI
ncbi:MAG: 3-phosphoshikimate 1-carboxyvinyltransferase [Tannerellaceae bacterium]|jgi:3-phosphoshikimate 1-carboxyvinyltransferase|nr:3-phosphoshikimate 1-carboxyvinyltransferase [Tannerellaceae bacterium]